MEKVGVVPSEVDGASFIWEGRVRVAAHSTQGVVELATTATDSWTK